jgi:hypothetical protein
MQRGPCNLNEGSIQITSCLDTTLSLPELDRNHFDGFKRVPIALQSYHLAKSTCLVIPLLPFHCSFLILRIDIVTMATTVFRELTTGLDGSGVKIGERACFRLLSVSY